MGMIVRSSGQGAVRGSGTLVGDIIDSQNRDVREVIKIGTLRRSIVDRIIANWKALTAVIFTSRSWWTFGDRSYLSRDGTYDYRENVRNGGRNNAIVMSAVKLNSTTFSQSPIQVMLKKDDSDEVVPDHEMIKLINKPNIFYSGKLLWRATIADWMFGNAYWIKLRSGAGKPAALYWIPSSMIKPRWDENDPTTFITHYEYTPNGKPLRVEVADVVHFRNGIDPDNLRMGLSNLGALMREIATDEEAAEYTNTILRNLGVAGMVISPKNENVKLSQPDADRVKQSVINRTSGDRRGEPLVLGGAVDVSMMGADPAKLDLSAIRHVPEERITAIFGTPAILLGLGTGLEHGTFNNVDGLRKIYYENEVIPTQELIGADIHTQLLVDYETNVDKFGVEFNNDNVRVLKEDESSLVVRLATELEHGTMTVNEARQLRGRKAHPDDFFALGSKIKVVAVDKVLEPPAPSQVVVAPPAAATGTDGNGKPVSADTAVGNSTSDGTANSGSDVSSGDGNNNASKLDSRASTGLHTKDVGDSIVRIRSRMLLSVQSDVQSYLDGQKAFVLGQIDEGTKAVFRVNWPRLTEDVDKLKSVLEPWYKRVLVAVHDVVQDVLDVRYELSGTEERTYVKNAGLNIKGINETTRASVARALKAAIDLDESAEELRARIEELDAFSSERAELIAKTELATATNLAQLESYKASEIVVGVLVTDGDSDKVCAAIDGTKVPIAEARSIPPLAHPHCVRKFHHITDASELGTEEAA